MDSRNSDKNCLDEPTYGAYHMLHRIDGELVAVGFLDIMPTILNSAYFIYNPKYTYLNLGVVSACLEVEFARWM